jgi:hypothetical protein
MIDHEKENVTWPRFVCVLYDDPVDGYPKQESGRNAIHAARKANAL